MIYTMHELASGYKARLCYLQLQANPDRVTEECGNHTREDITPLILIVCRPSGFVQDSLLLPASAGARIQTRQTTRKAERV